MSEGIKCNNNYVCIEDIITFETIEDPNKCVSLGDGICTTCEGVDTAKKANYELFGRNPIKSVFNIDKSPQENGKSSSFVKSKYLPSLLDSSPY